MQSFLTASVHPAHPHALPFRTIFEEHLRRRERDFLDRASSIFPPENEKSTWDLLVEALRHQENCYSNLAAANAAIASGGANADMKENIDALLKACHEADIPLKQLLHRMEASALCLSGGGIRSASFSLGVLEGLSRFSRSRSQGGLMDELDYLSTVSGGGYIGSWMMSWVYRRMDAARPYPLVSKSFDLTEESIRLCAALCLKTQELLSPPRDDESNQGKDLVSQLGELICACRQCRESADSALQNARAASLQNPLYNLFAATAKEALDGVEKAVAEVAGMDCSRAYTLLASTPPAKVPPLLLNLRNVSDSLTRALQSIRTGRVPDWKKPYEEVVSALAGETVTTGGDPAPQAIRHLRSYTSFLAPALGLTLDSFTLAAIVLRNLIVNWTMLVPVLFVLIGLSETSSFLLAKANDQLPRDFGAVLAAIITALFLLAASAGAVALPSHFKVRIPNLFRRFNAYMFLSAVVLASWLLVASWVPGTEIARWSRYMPASVAGTLRQLFPHDVWRSLATTPVALVGFGVLSLSIFLAYKERVEGLMVGRWRRKTAAGTMTILAAVVSSAISSGLFALLQWVVFPFLLTPPGHFLRNLASGKRLFIVFGVPSVISVLMIGTSLFCALLGVYEMEEDREWWVRSGGFLLAFCLVWTLAHGIALYGRGAWLRIIAGVTGLLLGLATSALGFSGETSAGARPVKSAQVGTVGRFLQKHDLVLPAISCVALFLIAIGTVAAEESLRKALPMADDLNKSLVVLAGSTVLAVLINFAININLFSLHGMYRMRLMRAFLGASNVFRRPDPFTHFDPRDTPHETDLPSGPGAPLHIINTTLNLSGTHNAAWRQRKAESFTFSPIHSGSWRLGYVPSCMFGGSRGVTVATAMSISGAAFNPNMGYQSSPLLSLLMTFFNLRLGYWLPNPARPNSTLPLGSSGANFFRKPGPSFALQPLIEDALGLTDDTLRWTELTDGGHFENLGLYEMVMRRCRHIIVVDAGADPKCQFEDLGNAIRKIYIDLGIPIEFPPDMKMKAGMKTKNSYCAVANINYSCVDPKPPGQEQSVNGHLVYIKAGLTGSEPADILQYAKTHETFPHETSANQFFNESQFESYRHLGSFIIECIAANTPPPPLAGKMEGFTEAANHYWLRPAGE